MPAGECLLEMPVTDTLSGSSEKLTAVTSFWEKVLPSGGGRARVDERGVYVGEALPLVPWKLAEKIQAWEFVEMAELLP